MQIFLPDFRAFLRIPHFVVLDRDHKRARLTLCGARSVRAPERAPTECGEGHWWPSAAMSGHVRECPVLAENRVVLTYMEGQLVGMHHK